MEAEHSTPPPLLQNNTKAVFYASYGQMWRPRSDHFGVHSPVGRAGAAGGQQSGVQSSVDEATDNAVKVAKQNRQAASETLSEVKRQISQHRAD